MPAFWETSNDRVMEIAGGDTCGPPEASTLEAEAVEMWSRSSEFAKESREVALMTET